MVQKVNNKTFTEAAFKPYDIAPNRLFIVRVQFNMLSLAFKTLRRLSHFSWHLAEYGYTDFRTMNNIKTVITIHIYHTEKSHSYAAFVTFIESTVSVLK